MRMILAVIVFLVIGVGPHWQKYKDEKIASYQAKHGGDVCEIRNVLIGVECRPFTQDELEAKEQDEALQRWNDRVADAEARKAFERKMEDLLIYGK